MEHSILPATVQLRRLAEQTPPNFVFAIKGSRYITHMLRLRGVEQALANFFASGPLALGPSSGQSSGSSRPTFQFKPDLLEEFFALLPRDTHTAATLAEKHDQRLKGRAYTDQASVAPSGTPSRFGIPASSCPHSSASCAATTSLSSVPTRSSGRASWISPQTSLLPPARSKVLYTSQYSPEELDQWQRA